MDSRKKKVHPVIKMVIVLALLAGLACGAFVVKDKFFMAGCPTEVPQPFVALTEPISAINEVDGSTWWIQSGYLLPDAADRSLIDFSKKFAACKSPGYNLRVEPFAKITAADGSRYICISCLVGTSTPLALVP